ncbi:rRNA maturation RNase YbeY [Patescibacteria group bacterium]|nr:rRNA maturation RNase YbeY [Patescibacteria group bacterium]
MLGVGFVFEYNNLAGGVIPFAFLKQTKKIIKKFHLVTGFSLQELSLVFVSRPVMRQLNTRHRHQNKVTDILSFTYQVEPIVGELIVCLDQAIIQAKRRQHSLAKELSILFGHGLLHLAGYDHLVVSERKIMRDLEKRILF